MKLTSNERKILKMLLKNAKMTDSSIASSLDISSQAVGKIRRKLEREFIDSYSVNLKYGRFGISTFAIAISEMTAAGMKKGEAFVEEKLLCSPNAINVFRVSFGKGTHIILYGFRDVMELDRFFRTREKDEDIHRYVKNNELYTFSHINMVKNNPASLFNKMIDELPSTPSRQAYET